MHHFMSLQTLMCFCWTSSLSWVVKWELTTVSLIESHLFTSSPLPFSFPPSPPICKIVSHFYSFSERTTMCVCPQGFPCVNGCIDLFHNQRSMKKQCMHTSFWNSASLAKVQWSLGICSKLIFNESVTDVPDSGFRAAADKLSCVLTRLW